MEGWSEMLECWLAKLDPSLAASLDPQVLDAATDVVETVQTRPHAVRGALRRLGSVLGEQAWPLEPVNTWVASLLPLVGRSARKHLATMEAIGALAEGWATGYVRGAHSGACLDPVTGLATRNVLQLRMREVLQHCRAFGIDAAEAYCFVVVDANTDDLPAFERDAVMITVGATVGDVFSSGETVARHRGRIVVLASNSAVTRRRVEELGERLLAAPISRSVQPLTWIDGVPGTGREMDRYLAELVG